MMEVTSAEWVEQWWPTVVNLSASTRATRRAILNHHVLAKFGRVQLGRITHTSVATWIAELEASGSSPATVVKCQVLSRVLAGAVDAGMLSRNVTTKVGLPRVRMQEMRFLTCEQVAALAGCSVGGGASTALPRAGVGGGVWRFPVRGLAGLRRRRVDLAGRVRIEETCVEVAGELHWGAPKTDAGRRTVALPAFVAQALREHQAKWSGTGICFRMLMRGWRTGLIQCWQTASHLIWRRPRAYRRDSRVLRGPAPPWVKRICAVQKGWT
jgi:hypothetical protein